MNTLIQKVMLQSECHFQGKLPPHHLGLLLAELPLAIRAAVSMAFRNRSEIEGRHPDWLERAADVRFVDLQTGGESILYFEAPRLGDAASELYAQQRLFTETEDRPAAEDTAFDLLGDVLLDVQQRQTDSCHFDAALLARVAKFDQVFRNSPFAEIDFVSHRFPSDAPARCTPRTVESARELLGKTPSPQRVRLVGRLNGLAAGTQRFLVLLDTGEEVIGVFPEDQTDSLQRLSGQRVLVLGSAVYRASGRLLRIDAEAVLSGEHESSVFSRLPAPPSAKIASADLRKPQGPRSGVAAIMSHWPGDESEEKISEALERLS